MLSGKYRFGALGFRTAPLVPSPSRMIRASKLYERASEARVPYLKHASTLSYLALWLSLVAWATSAALTAEPFAEVFTFVQPLPHVAWLSD